MFYKGCRIAVPQVRRDVSPEHELPAARMRL